MELHGGIPSIRSMTNGIVEEDVEEGLAQSGIERPVGDSCMLENVDCCFLRFKCTAGEKAVTDTPNMNHNKEDTSNRSRRKRRETNGFGRAILEKGEELEESERRLANDSSRFVAAVPPNYRNTAINRLQSSERDSSQLQVEPRK